MEEFIQASSWGTGLSLGVCVGLVTWMFLKEAVNRLMGVPAKLDDSRRINLLMLDSLQTRNRLTEETNELLERIAGAIEMFDDDDGDPVEVW